MEKLETEKMTRKQREFLRREQEILQAALSLFEGPHWEQVTVEQISRKADIGKGTVYKHFECKEDIYAKLAIAFNRRLLERFRTVAEEQDQIFTILQEHIRIAFAFFLNNPGEARVSFYCKRKDFRERLSGSLREEFDELDQQFTEFMQAMLQRGIDQQLFPNRPTEHLLMGLEATFDGAISMIWNDNIECEPEACVQIISEFMMAGLVGLQTPASGLAVSGSQAN